jgi:hypothetical protein
MFEWFFENKTYSNYSKLIIRCENILKEIEDIRESYKRMGIKLGREKYKELFNHGKIWFTMKDNIEDYTKMLKKRIPRCIAYSENSLLLINQLNKDLKLLKNNINYLESYLYNNNLIKELGNTHSAIKVLEKKFNNLRELLIDVRNLQNLFDKIISNNNIQSLNASYFKKECNDNLIYLNNNINTYDIKKKYDISNNISVFIKNYISSLREIKIHLNTYYYEFELLEKLVKNHKKGKKDLELLESVFGKSLNYNFDKTPQNETDLVNKLIYNMRKSMSEDEINNVMHKIRFKLIDKADFLTRGISDKEAKIFLSTIKEFAESTGLIVKKNIDGFGYMHSAEHFSELIEVINPKYSSIKKAMEDTIKNPKFNIPSRGQRLLCNPINNGNLFLVAIMNPTTGFISFYHMDNSSKNNGLLNSIKMMIINKDLTIYKNISNEEHYIIPFSINQASTHIIEYEKRNDNKVYVTAKHIGNNELSELLTRFKEDNNIDKCQKFIDKTRKKQIIDLQALAA